MSDVSTTVIRWLFWPFWAFLCFITGLIDGSEGRTPTEVRANFRDNLRHPFESTGEDGDA